MKQLTLSKLESILDLNKALKGDRKSLIILDHKNNFIFNRSVNWLSSCFREIILEAIELAPEFVDMLIKKYISVLPETLYEAGFGFGDEYEIIDILDLPNVNKSNQAILNQLKEQYCCIYNATMNEPEDFEISINTPEAIKYLAQLIVWYDYLSCIEQKLPPQRSKKICAEIVTLEQKKEKRMYGNGTVDFDRSLSNFRAHLTNWFNGVTELFKIPRLSNNQAIEKSKMLPIKFELGVRLKPNSEYKHVSRLWKSRLVHLENAYKAIYALDNLCKSCSQKPLFKHL